MYIFLDVDGVLNTKSDWETTSKGDNLIDMTTRLWYNLIISRYGGGWLCCEGKWYLEKWNDKDSGYYWTIKR